MRIKRNKAVYLGQEIKEYKGNPFIEAMPSILSNKDVIEKLATYPYFNEEERMCEKHIRLHIIQRIFQFFQPLPKHLELESSISRLIRQGYISRNPLTKEYVEALNNGYLDIKNGFIEENNNYNATASSIILVGVSGMGKTTILNKILDLIPQVIEHSKYKDIPLCLTQVTWIKLDCPYDGSLKALCLDFFNKVDELIDSNYFNKYYNSRLSANAMLPIIKQISMNIGLGVLVIDEIQHLSTAKNGGAEKMLNFFVTLINTVSVPVILVGTPKALPIFQSEFRQARRSCGQGNMFWDRLEKDEEFLILLEELWEYQWIRKPQKLTKEIVDTIYEESQGIIDIIIKLFFMAQIRAISSGKEMITVKLIKEVADENLKILRPMLKALKSGNIKDIANYPDIIPIDITKVIQNEQRKVDFCNDINKLKEVKERKKEESKLDIKEKITINLLKLGYKENDFKSILEEIINLEEKDSDKLTRVVIDMISNKKFNNETKINYKKALLEENDIRYLAQKAKEENITVYEKLKEAKYIKTFENLLNQEGVIL